MAVEFGEALVGGGGRGTGVVKLVLQAGSWRLFSLFDPPSLETTLVSLFEERRERSAIICIPT